MNNITSPNLKEMFNINYIKGYCTRNKKIYLISISISILFILIGYTFTGLIQEEIENNNLEDSSLIDKNQLISEMNIQDCIELFIHNLSIDLSVVLNGFLFSVMALVITFVNTAMIGIVGSILPPQYLIMGIIPHGIFEIPCSLIAFAGALMATKLEIKLIKALFHYKLKEEIRYSSYLIKDILFSVMIIVIFLGIAAIIETYITPILLISIS